MGKRWDKIKGEMSNLRRGWWNPLGWRVVGGSAGTVYNLDSSRVDVTKARGLYNNTDDHYKLGAGFAKPIVNTTVGFMGLPAFVMEEETAQEVMDRFMNENRSKVLQTIRNSLRDGDCFVWITREEAHDRALYPESEKRIVYNIIPPEQVVEIRIDPLSGNVESYILQSTYEWKEGTGDNAISKHATIKQTINKDQRIIDIEGDPIPGLETMHVEETNPWGFIPIIHFANESDAHEQYGKSDLEVVEPFLKAYHDVMLHAIKGSKMHSTPRLKMNVRDVAGFLANNFGVTDPEKWAREGGTIDLNGHEILFFQADEDAGFIEAKSTIGDATTLLEFLFYCIVDASETPEFAFGVHTPSSLASVKEQMPILTRRISRKRSHFDLAFKRLARIVLAMNVQSGMEAGITSFKGELEWDDIDPRDGKEIAEEIKAMADALDKALKGGFISIEAAVDAFSEFVTTMNKWDDSDVEEDQKEKNRIMQSRIMSQGLEDGQQLDGQRTQIESLIERMRQRTSA